MLPRERALCSYSASKCQRLIAIRHSSSTCPARGDTRHEMEMQRRLREAVKDLAAEIVTFRTSSDPARRPAQFAIAQILAALA